MAMVRQAALDHRLLDVVDRILDAARAVAHDVELDIGREATSEARRRRRARLSATSMVLEPWVLTTSMARERTQAFRMARLSRSCWPSTTVATWRR